MSGAAPALMAQGSVDIRRPCHDVFAYVSNMENFSAWFPGVASIRALDALDHGRVGRRYRETLRMPFGRTSTIDLEVKEARPEAHLMTEGEGFLLPRMCVTFVPLSTDMTRVDHEPHQAPRPRGASAGDSHGMG